MELNFESLLTAWPIVPICGYLSRLKVADAVPQDGSEIGVEHIAACTGLDSDLLYRLLRMVTGAGVFKESAGKKFSHTAVSRKMVTGGELELLLLFHAQAMTLNSFTTLEAQLKDPSKSAFEHHYKVPFFSTFGSSWHVRNFRKAYDNADKTVTASITEVYRATA